MKAIEMIQYLAEHTKYAEWNGPAHHLAWNVKMNFMYLDWTGWEGEKTMGENIEHRWDERWNENVDLYSNDLWDWMIEDVRRQFELADDQDYTSYHSDHNDQGDWEFYFLGRSGGWLVLNKWKGNSLSGDHDDYVEWLQELSDKDLTFLYNCIHYMDTVEFTKANIRRVANEVITSIRATMEMKWQQEAKEKASAYITGVAMN